MHKVFDLNNKITPPGRLDALTGLRCYAALMVVFFHISLNRFFMPETPAVEQAQYLLSNAGWLGVTFFFVLSGFVLTWSQRPGDMPLDFLWRRLAKIGPNHVVTFCLAFAVAGLAGAEPWEALSNLLLLHAWVPRDTAFFSINHPSWSLSAELFFYACFPLLIGPLTRIKTQNLLPLALLLLIAILGMPLLATTLQETATFGENHAQSPLYGVSIPQVWAVYALPPVRLLEFVLGMISARMVRNQVLSQIPLGWGLLAIPAGYAASFMVPVLWQMSAIYVVPVLLLIVAAAQCARPPALLASPLAVRLGEISFGVYMVHDIVLMALGRLFGPLSFAPGSAALLMFGVVATSLGFGWALWRWVETPANQYLRSFSLPSSLPLKS